MVFMLEFQEGLESLSMEQLLTQVHYKIGLACLARPGQTLRFLLTNKYAPKSLDSRRTPIW